MRAGSRPLSSPGGAWVSNVARAASSHQPWARLPGGPMGGSTTDQGRCRGGGGGVVSGVGGVGGEGATTAACAGRRMLGFDGQQGVDQAWSAVATFVPKLAAFLVIVLIGDVVAMLLARAVQPVLARIGLDAWAQRGILRR